MTGGRGQLRHERSAVRATRPIAIAFATVVVAVTAGCSTDPADFASPASVDAGEPADSGDPASAGDPTAAPGAASFGQPSSAAADALTSRALDELSAFAQWLSDAGAAGHIGEVGWPGDSDAQQWNALAERWYGHAAAADLTATYWATGQWWGSAYPLSAYVASHPYHGPLDTARPQSAVIEGQQRAGMRMITVNGGEFGENVPQVEPTSTFSNRSPGRYGTDWRYDDASTFTYLAARGITSVRLPFRWERVQPRPFGGLATSEVQRLRTALDRAHRVGLDVVLDLHNYGGYYADHDGRGVRLTVGSSELPDAALSDVWTRLSREFRGHPAVSAYALMAEPAQMPALDGVDPARRWERSSQAVVTAIRDAGDITPLLVPGYNWSAVRGWAATHPRPWISDPAGAFMYEAHHYWDDDGGGTYRSYAAELDAAELDAADERRAG